MNAISAYVRQVEKGVPGPRGTRRELLRELADGLRDAAGAYQAAGLPVRDAERRAVADAGPASDVAAAYRLELTAAQGGRTAALFALSMPAMTLAWTLLWRLWPSATALATPAEPSSLRLISMLSQIMDAFGILGGMSGLAGLALVTWTARRGRPVRPVIAALVVVCGITVASIMASSVAINLLTPARVLDMVAAPTALAVVSLVTVMTTAWQVLSLWRSARLAFGQSPS